MSERSGAGHLDERQEIIIVRRRPHGGDEGHHGGVWKIAFADFMTAMMAFFLVMWLTNASDMATRQQVAQYFNPIRLSDAYPATRGVESKDDGADKEAKEKGVSRVATNGDPNGKPMAGDETGGEEQALFRDPYAVLAEIAANNVSSGTGKEQGVPDGSGMPGLNGGDAYRDPFDPASWQLEPNAVEGAETMDVAPPAEFSTAVVPVEDPGDEPDTAKAGDIAAVDAAAGEGAEPVPDPAASGASDIAAKAEDVREEIAVELAKAGEILPPNLKVSATGDGIAISLADDIATGMFQIGSAKPTAEAVAMMERIAAVIAKRPGTIVIRGHTDARPFSGGEYDNWRLSTARAHMAYYMLSRGGLDVGRVKAIEGVADRDPALPGDPDAAANRRIEILLSEKAP